MKKLAQMWKTLPAAEKKEFDVIAEADKARYFMKVYRGDTSFFTLSPTLCSLDISKSWQLIQDQCKCRTSVEKRIRFVLFIYF